MHESKALKCFLLVLTFICCVLTASLPIIASEESEFRDLYTVQQGDTLYRIAFQHNTTPEAIAKENAIDDPHWIYTGQTLSIPIDSSNYLGCGFYFSFEPVDGYRQAHEKIAGYRFVNDSKIVGSWKNVGTCIEMGEFQKTIAQQCDYIHHNPSGDLVFAEYGDIKKGGDFAWTAGTIYNYPWKCQNSSYIIQTIGSFKYMFLEYNIDNQIFNDTRNFPPGAKYIVYRKYEKVHMVKPGDTLNEIAEAYNTTAEMIAKINNIDDINKIGIFQKLKMPAAN